MVTPILYIIAPNANSLFLRGLGTKLQRQMIRKPFVNLLWKNNCAVAPSPRKVFLLVPKPFSPSMINGNFLRWVKLRQAFIVDNTCTGHRVFMVYFADKKSTICCFVSCYCIVVDVNKQNGFP